MMLPPDSPGRLSCRQPTPLLHFNCPQIDQNLVKAQYKWWEEEELRAGRVQLSVRASVLRTLFEGLGSVCHPPPSPTV